MSVKTWYPALDERNGEFQLLKAERKARDKYSLEMLRIQELRRLHERYHGRNPYSQATTPAHSYYSVAERPIFQPAGARLMSRDSGAGLAPQPWLSSDQNQRSGAQTPQRQGGIDLHDSTYPNKGNSNSQEGRSGGQNQGTNNHQQGQKNQNQDMNNHQGQQNQKQGMNNQQGQKTQNQGMGNQQGQKNQNHGMNNQQGQKKQNQGMINRQGQEKQDQGMNNQQQGVQKKVQNQGMNNQHQNQGMNNQHQNQGMNNQHQNQGNQYESQRNQSRMSFGGTPGNSQRPNSAMNNDRRNSTFDTSSRSDQLYSSLNNATLFNITSSTESPQLTDIRCSCHQSIGNGLPRKVSRNF